MTQPLPFRSNIHLHADLVLELIDNFTQQLVQHCRMSFVINGQIKNPTNIKNGLIIFCNLGEVPENIEIRSDLYQRKVIQLEDSEVNDFSSGSYVHRIIRLEPSNRYNIPKWATVIEGQVEVGQEHVYEGTNLHIQAVVDKMTDHYRIKNNTSDKPLVMIHQTNSEILLGRFFYGSDMTIKDAFELIKKIDDGYLPSPEATQILEPHTLLTEVKHVDLDDRGHFMMVLPKIEASLASVKLYIHGQKIGEMQFHTGKWNDVGKIKVSI